MLFAITPAMTIEKMPESEILSDTTRDKNVEQYPAQNTDLPWVEAAGRESLTVHLSWLQVDFSVLWSEMG